MEKVPSPPEGIPDLASGLLKLDHSTVAAEVRERMQASMNDLHDRRAWKAQYNFVLGDRLRKEIGITLDLSVSRIGIEILWNYFWQIYWCLSCSNQVFRESKETIIDAVTEMAQHGAMLSQTKFFTIEKTRPAMRGDTESPFVFTGSGADNTLTVTADPILLEHCRRTKEANEDSSTKHCPALASMHQMVASLYDVFCVAVNEEELRGRRSVSEIEYC